jgi:hypothetical protein
MAEKQGINFYELGRKSGATTSKTQQSGLQALVGSIDKTVGGMLKTSKAATAALTAAMPSGVAIEKVPEQLRGQVSKYLADNKKAYTDAAAVIASGINPQSQRYKDAVETMNSVSTKFENLSNNLEAIAVARKDALDNPDYSPATNDEDALVFNNLANGSLYNTMNINDDGTFNYKDAEGNDKLFSDFKVRKQGFTGQQGYLALVEDAQKQAGVKGMTFEALKGKYQTTIDTLFDQLGPRGALDYAFADKDFTAKYLKDNNKELNDLKKNPGDFVQKYKEHNMIELEKAYNKAPKYSKDITYTQAYYTSLDKKAKIGKKFDDINVQEKRGDQSIVGSQAVLRDAEGSLQFIKNQLGIPRSADIFMKKDEDGGYSYYVKKSQMPEGYEGPFDKSKAVLRDQVIQKAYEVDDQGNFIPQKLVIDNFDFLLREYNLY